MPYELKNFESPSALAQAAATAWLTAVEATKTKQCVAVSGGRIAKDFFGAIVENARTRAVSLDKVHFFWADERCVRPDDRDSNFALANQCLFQPLSIPASQIHRIPGALPPQEAARV